VTFDHLGGVPPVAVPPVVEAVDRLHRVLPTAAAYADQLLLVARSRTGSLACEPTTFRVKTTSRTVLRP
jgi:hypothetical protein